MSSRTQSPEQRQHVRCQLNGNIFVDIHGNYFDSFASVTDLNRNGVGFYSVSEARVMVDKYIRLDLVSDRSHVILRSLLSRVVFTHEILQHEKGAAETSRRYGLKFVNVSALQKRQLDIITKKYAQPKHKKNLPDG